MTMSNLYPKQPPNPFTKGSKHAYVWDTLAYNPAVFYFREGNSTYNTGLCIKPDDYNNMVKMFRLLGFNAEEISCHMGFSTRNRDGSGNIIEYCLVGIPERYCRLFKSYLKRLQDSQKEKTNG